MLQKSGVTFDNFFPFTNTRPFSGMHFYHLIVLLADEYICELFTKAPKAVRPNENISWIHWLTPFIFSGVEAGAKMAIAKTIAREFVAITPAYSGTELY